MTDPQALSACQGDHCITCADEGRPMTVTRVDEDRGLALCADADGARSTVEVALVQPITTGDTVLVHAGVALVNLGTHAHSIGGPT